jgi:3-methyladenine DNA glycosylase AlkD
MPRPSTRNRDEPSPVRPDVGVALAWLRRHGSDAGVASLARYGIPTNRAFGLAMRDIQALGKRLGRDHELAGALWSTGWYEARLLAAYVDDPVKVTAAQMDRWCRDFDSWAVCDTLCFVLFDKAPDAWAMVNRWASRKGEFQKRAAFALLWGLAGHDRTAGDGAFRECLTLIEDAAADDRHYVTKAVVMALAAIGKRRPGLRDEAVAVAERLAASPQGASRRVGTDALRALAKPLRGPAPARRQAPAARPRSGR